MSRFKWLLAGVCLVAAGCADAPTGGRAIVSAPQGPPLFDSYADPDPRWPISIRSYRASIDFSYPTWARVDAEMRYDAYHARMFGQARIRQARPFGSAETVSLPTRTRHTPSFVNNLFVTHWDIRLGTQCGWEVHASVGFEAWWQVPGYEVDVHSAYSEPFSGQPPCECADQTDNHLETGYDPYYGEPPDDDCTGSGGGTSEPSGNQYAPGDYTGGETVDWETGRGNGGQSVCGDNARVEYICIETYNEETQAWEVWSCGYATTC